jgi:hypothetical protein
MNEKTLAQLCLAITIASMIVFVITYTPEFKETTIGELLEKEGRKGIVFGRIEYIAKNYPTTVLILNDKNTATIYYPRATTFEKNDFVTAYLENQGRKELFAHKVVKK